MSKRRADEYPMHLDWFRYFCAFMLYTYGISKLLHLQFDMQAQLAPRPVGTLTGYELTWFYFGYSPVYADVLGLTQVLGGTLLLFRKTTLLGALSMLPVMGNVLLINMFILVDDYGPFVISGIICTFLLFVLWHQRQALVSLLWTTQKSESADTQRLHRWIGLSVALAAITMMVSGAIIQEHVKRSRELSLHPSTVSGHDYSR